MISQIQITLAEREIDEEFEEGGSGTPLCVLRCSNCISGVCHGCTTGYLLTSDGLCQAISINCVAGKYKSGNQCLGIRFS